MKFSIDDHRSVEWWHSIDLGNGVVTHGYKSPDVCAAEFDRLELSEGALRGRRVLDVGCNDGYMSLSCAKLGADVIGIDGIHRDGMKLIQSTVRPPNFKFYCLDLMSPTFLELGRFDVVLYLGVLYHTIYPFEQLLRLANACNRDALLFVETEYYDMPGFEDQATIMFNYEGEMGQDLTSPVYPSVVWVKKTLARIGFSDISVLHKDGEKGRGRVTVRGRFLGGSSPILFASEQA